MISRRAFAMIVPMAAASTLRLRAAGVDGKWEAEIDSPMGPMILTFELKSDGESLTGTIGNDLMGDVEIQEGKVSGDEVSFVQTQARGDFEIRMMYTGTGDGRRNGASRAPWSVRPAAEAAHDPVAERPHREARAAAGVREVLAAGPGAGSGGRSPRGWIPASRHVCGKTRPVGLVAPGARRCPSGCQPQAGSPPAVPSLRGFERR